MIGPLGVFADVLVADDWPFQVQSDGRTLQFTFQGEHATWTCFVRAHDDDIVIVYSQFPDRVPTPRRPAMAELITRLNYLTPIGNLEMDLDDGEIRARTAVDAAGIALDHRHARHALHASVRLVEDLLPAIDAVIAGGAPADAVDLVDEIHSR